MIGYESDRLLEEFLTVESAGLFASFNFMGYLSGAILTIFITDINAKVKLFRLGVFLSVVTTLSLAVTTNEDVWFVSRTLAGFGSALTFLVGSAIVMIKLGHEDKTKAMGIHFSGIGIGIVVSELISRYVLLNANWEYAWIVLGLFALFIGSYAVYMLSFEKALRADAQKHKASRSMFTSYVILLILAYFTAGVGFVVQATFFPDIINSLEGLSGYGNLGWLVVGVAGVPSAILWMKIARVYGSINTIIMAFILQIVGILIPAFTNDVMLNLLSGALYGTTFIAHVALFMHYGGKLAGKKSRHFHGSHDIGLWDRTSLGTSL
ncbi:MAG: YbfB/YjiJ family MFS transporter [Campylobacterota bacterium]|nr:YbfB/YjiJ family MFS transporter [Campylobacterota bacterium]